MPHPSPAGPGPSCRPAGEGAASPTLADVLVALLRSRGLVLDVEGVGEVVAVADLVAALTGSTPEPVASVYSRVQTPPPPSEWVSTAEAASILGIDRGTLDRMRDRAPRNLPGAPVAVGEGRERRSWRWRRATLGGWFAAYQTWTQTAGRRAPRP